MPQKAQSHCESSKTSDRCRLSGAQLQCSARRLRTQMVQPSMKAKHKRRAVSLGRSFLLHERTFSKTFEDLRASTLRSSPWERIPRVTPVYLLASQRSKIRQSSLVPSHSLCTPYERCCLWTSTTNEQPPRVALPALVRTHTDRRLLA